MVGAATYEKKGEGRRSARYKLGDSRRRSVFMRRFGNKRKLNRARHPPGGGDGIV
jgi:hypothetical protein